MVLPIVVATPAVGADAVQQAMDDFAIPAMSAPVELTVTGLPHGSRTVVLKPRDFGPTLGDDACTGRFPRARR